MKNKCLHDSYLEYSNVDQDFDIGIVIPEAFFFKINVDVEQENGKEVTSGRFQLSGQDPS